MGSELLVGVLEIDKGTKPDWAAAEALLAALGDEEVKSAYMRAMDLNEALLEEQGVELPKMRAELQAALVALHEGWDGAGGHIVRSPGARTEMLIGGGTSWGEDIEACNQMNLFWESGMARAAGFLDTTGASDAAEDGEG
jgi:hypothetical protein